MNFLNTGEDLNKGKAKLDDLIRRMEAEMVEVNDCKEQLQTKDGQLEELIEKFKENNKDVPIDEAFGPTQALYKQLLNSFAEENAIVDAIYYLGEALRKGVIDLEVFLKVSQLHYSLQYIFIFITECSRDVV